MEPQRSDSLWSSSLTWEKSISNYDYKCLSDLIMFNYCSLSEDWPEGHQLAANMKFKFMQVVWFEYFTLATDTVSDKLLLADKLVVF